MHTNKLSAGAPIGTPADFIEIKDYNHLIKRVTKRTCSFCRAYGANAYTATAVAGVPVSESRIESHVIGVVRERRILRGRLVDAAAAFEVDMGECAGKESNSFDSASIISLIEDMMKGF